MKNRHSALTPVFDLLGVDTPPEMQNAYIAHDQLLFKSRTWDYSNSGLVINKVKDLLLSIDPIDLTFEEDEHRRQILWFWFHHAVSCALWKSDRNAALFYSEAASALNFKENENQISTWLYLMVRERFSEAHALAQSMRHDSDTALDLEHELVELVKKLR